MPTFLDVHYAPGIKPDDAERAHGLDLHFQAKHGVEYHKYWLNVKDGAVYCLCTAPSAEAADAVHQESLGLSAAKIMEISPEVAEIFLGSAEIDKAGAVLLPGRGEHDPATRTILFTDIVGSTDLTQRIGDEAALERLKLHDSIVRSAMTAMSGREVKHTGDGIMAVFFSAASAVHCAIDVQRCIQKHSNEHPDLEIRLRIGIASGEPIEHHEDLYGSAVQLAARLCAHADPDQILMSNAVAELCIGKTFPLKEVGPVSLKGFDTQVRVHCVAQI